MDLAVRCGLVCSFVLGVAIPRLAVAQDWSGGRQTPALRELVLLDPTGEGLWPFGAEDVAGDGLGTFEPAEASVDIRSLYAAADGQRSWARLHVASGGEPGAQMVAFLFIDVDDDPASGGGADSTDLHARFVDDPTGGGYEIAVGMRGDGTLIDAWRWAGAAWAPIQRADRDVRVSVGVDLDPLRLGADDHGYLQAEIAHGLSGLDASCAAVLFVRTWNDAPGEDYGDLDVGERSRCVAADGDGDGAPDIVEGYDCDGDEDCARNGTCVDGACVAGGGGDGDADADSDADADADGDVDAGFDLEDGEVQGGACTCRTSGGDTPGGVLLLLFLSIALGRGRRR